MATVHRVTFLLAFNRPAEAAEAATKALIALKALDGDLSVNAIRGGAASILCSDAGYTAGDIGATLIAQDHAGACPDLGIHR